MRHLRQFNDWLALRITAVIGTMWTAYLFTILAVVSLPGAVRSHNTVIIVAWIAQTFLQLVLLPIIIVGQALQSAEHQRTRQQVAELHDKHDLAHEALNRIEQALGLGAQEVDS